MSKQKLIYHLVFYNVPEEPTDPITHLNSGLDALAQRSKQLLDDEFKMYAKRGFSYYEPYGDAFLSIRNRLFKHKFGDTCIILNNLSDVRDLFDFLYWQGTNPLFRRDLSLEGELNLINLSADIQRFKTSHSKLSHKPIRGV